MSKVEMPEGIPDTPHTRRIFEAAIKYAAAIEASGDQADTNNDVADHAVCAAMTTMVLLGFTQQRLSDVIGAEVADELLGSGPLFAAHKMALARLTGEVARG